MEDSFQPDTSENLTEASVYSRPETSDEGNPLQPEMTVSDSGESREFRGRQEDEAIERESHVQQDGSSSEPEVTFEHVFQKAFAEQLEVAVQHRMLTHNLLGAQEQYGDEFEAAYRSVLNIGSKDLIQKILSRDDPGEGIVQWYRKACILTEVPDGDLDSWVRQRYAELMSGGHTSGQDNRPPPSLTGARGSGRQVIEGAPENAFSYAFGQ